MRGDDVGLLLEFSSWHEATVALVLDSAVAEFRRRPPDGWQQLEEGAKLHVHLYTALLPAAPRSADVDSAIPGPIVWSTCGDVLQFSSPRAVLGSPPLQRVPSAAFSWAALSRELLQLARPCVCMLHTESTKGNDTAGGQPQGRLRSGRMAARWMRLVCHAS